MIVQYIKVLTSLRAFFFHAGTQLRAGGREGGETSKGKTHGTNSGPMAFGWVHICCASGGSILRLFTTSHLRYMCDTARRTCCTGGGADPFIGRARPLVVLSSILVGCLSFFPPACIVRSPALCPPMITKPAAHAASQMGETEGRDDSPRAFWRDEEECAAE